jgi:queuosine precursor transporter
MNELIFFVHVAVVMLAVLGAVRLGREALIAIIALQAVIANLFVIKQITLFGMHVTSGDVYIVGSMLGLNLLQEFHGQESVRKSIWISFGALLFLGVMGQFQLLYRPNAHDFTQEGFEMLLSPQPRILFASLAAFFVVQQLDMRLFSWLKQRFARVPLALRSGTSLAICQTVDTILFAFLGLFGMVSNVGHIILICLIVKFTIIACMTPLTGLARRVHGAHV